MSVLIKKIKMPQKDRVRVLILRDDGRCIDELGDTYEIAEPPHHGRLIDADELKKHFSELIFRLLKNPEISKNTEYMARASAMAIEVIDNASTIIEEDNV